MKALMVTPFFEYRYGGAEFIMRIQRQCLEERGIQIDVLCLEGGTEVQGGKIWRLPLPASLKSRPLAVRRGVIFVNNPWFDGYFFRAAHQLGIPFEQYDLIHCQTAFWINLGARVAARHQKPCALTFHDNFPREIIAGMMPFALRWILQSYARIQAKQSLWALRSCRWLAGVSNHVGFKLLRALGPTAPPIYTIYNPAPPLNLGLDSPTSAPRIPQALYIGRYSKEKGLDILLDAFLGISVPLELGILGLEGPLQAMAQKAAARDSRIRLHKPVPHSEVPAFFRAHDIICCPSVWNDPLPGTVIESRMFQRAILASDRGGIPEILDGYTRAAMVGMDRLSRPQVIAALREGLVKAVTLVNHPLDASREQKFLHQFSRPNFAEQYSQLYLRGQLEHSINNQTG